MSNLMGSNRVPNRCGIFGFGVCWKGPPSHLRGQGEKRRQNRGQRERERERVEEREREKEERI
jgi:hypothetical protein